MHEAAYVIALVALVAAVAGRSDRVVIGRLVALRLVEGRSSGSSWALETVGRRFPRGRARARVEARLAAGGRDPTTSDRVLGAKVLAAGLAAAVGAMLPAGAGRVPVLGLLAAAGYVVPDFRLARRVTAMRRRARNAVPELLDLVAVSVSAGLTPRIALDRAAAVVGGPLGAELSRARAEVTLGTPWRRALRDLAQRTDLEELRRLSVTLSRSERLGSPVAERLRALAREVRAERRAEAEERARRAPVAMLFPLVFLILPAFVLAAVVPAVLVATRGIG